VQKLKISILLVMLSHLLLIGLYPIMDTTEARYADIARRMLELNDWITPWFDDGQPFWGKPPLSFWVTLLGFNVFGINEFGARFFYWVVSLLVLAITYACAKRHGQFTAITAVAILTSFTLFYVVSVAVMTDMVLLLGAVIALYSQINVLHKQENTRTNSMLLGVGLAIGLLAKGPIAVILFITPMLFWVVGTQQLRFMFERYNVLLVLAITAIIALPWYVIAEQKTPGFLNYFILGEHWQRFLVPGWEGDLYGSAHDSPRGTIWLFMLTATVPWCIMLPYLVYRHRQTMLANNNASSPAWFYLMAGWVLTPLLFFSFASNILWTYVLPGFPALAIFLAQIFVKSIPQRTLIQILQLALASVVLIKVIYLVNLMHDNKIEFKTAKYLIAELQAKQVPLDHVYFYEEVPFSAKLYSRGLIKKLTHLTPDALKTLENRYVLIEKDSPVSLHTLPKHSRKVMEYGEYDVWLIRH